MKYIKTIELRELSIIKVGDYVICDSELDISGNKTKNPYYIITSIVKNKYSKDSTYTLLNLIDNKKIVFGKYSKYFRKCTKDEKDKINLLISINKYNL